MLITKINITNEMNEAELTNAYCQAAKENTKKYFLLNPWYSCFYNDEEIKVLYRIMEELAEKIINALKFHNDDIKEYIKYCNHFVDLFQQGRTEAAIEFSENVLDKRYPYINQLTISHIVFVPKELKKARSSIV